VESVVAGKVVSRAGLIVGEPEIQGVSLVTVFGFKAVHFVLEIATVVVLVTLEEMGNAFAILAVKEVVRALGRCWNDTGKG